MKIELDPDLEQAVREKILSGEFQTADDLVQRAVRRFLDDEREMDHTETLLKEAMESGEYIELDETEWDKIESEAIDEVRARREAPR